MAKARHALPVTRAENFADWYQAVITGADMAEHSGVRGCMVIKPWGFRLWEALQRRLDRRIRETGHENCYFPLFIPLHLIEKEAEHVEGFAKEMAVVTHHRLEMKDGELVPAAPLEEPLVVRPTSETMIGEAFARWVRSWRDLPVLINQWANVVRWEMRPRLFLRTTEFLWQEGHTAHATAEEAMEETRRMLEVYREVVEGFLRIPVIAGVKSEGERFPGAVETHTIEAMMQDGRALQSGTSHFLGQNFARAAGIRFQDRDGELKYAWTTSWGASTRLIGALIMTHADDDGLRLPPEIAPHHLVVLPIIREEGHRAAVMEAAERLVRQAGAQVFDGETVRAHLDARDLPTPDKRWEWVRKGVPFILEIGPRDIEKGTVAVTDRLDLAAGKSFPTMAEFLGALPARLAAHSARLFEEARAMRKARTRRDITSADEMRGFFAEEGSGFVIAPWSEDEASLEAIADLGVSVRCLPYDQPADVGPCVLTGRPAKRVAVFAKAY